MLYTVQDGNTLTAHLSGDLDHGAAAGMREELDALLEDRSIRSLVLDLKEVPFMDSSGIGFVIGRYKRLKRRGGTVRVVNAGARMRQIFQMSGLYEILEAQGGGTNGDRK